jgi:Tol biopolymer transport system component
MAAVKRVLPILALALVSSGTVHAQYFGRNAVQWERLKFEVLKTSHFDIYHYAEEKEAADQVGRMAERWYTRLSRILGHKFKDRQPIVLYASHGHFEQTNTIGGPPGEGTGGVTEAFKRRIVLPVGGSLAETDHVLGHELVHAFQYAMTGQGRVTSTQYPAALNMPLWFIEGMAEYLSLGPVDANTSMWLRDAARKDKGLPRIGKLGKQRYFPYRYGQALWAYLASRFGDRVTGDALRHLGPRSNDADEILKRVTGLDEKTLSADWHAAIRASLGPVIAGKKDPDAYGTALVTEKKDGGKLNVGPALSPDGTRLAFLSEREQLSVELFVQDLGHGGSRRLSKTAVDPHLDSLQFISSAGSWDHQGRRLAFGATAKGRPLLLILDADSGSKLREIPLPTLGEISSPTFSPDGRSVAFSALGNGFSDLFSCDLESGQLKRLTNDAYGDLQPAWSPDGKTIAFGSDRFSSNLETIDMGNYRLAAIDLESGEIRALTSFTRGKSINPQWSKDGASLYFVSDRTGIPNVHRLDVATGTVFQLTDLLTGVSGITPLSPALTSAAGTNRIAFSVYDDGRYEIYAQEAEKLAGWEIGHEENETAAVIPGAKAAGDVFEARQDATTGLAEAESFSQAPYKAKLSLDYVGQPYVGVGVDRYGAFFAGGTSMLFSDMLGNHQLAAMLQTGNITGFADLGGAGQYVNRARRFNWGTALYRVPDVFRSFAAGVRTSNGEQVYVEQVLEQRFVEQGAAALGYYPFDSSLRLELSAGYRHIGFDTTLDTVAVSLATGQLVTDSRERLDSSSANLFEGAVALVRDTAVLGPTSPIVGQRFRLEVSPVTGTVDYTGVLADYRQYVRPVKPFTLAARFLHYGRYGSGGSDPRLSPLFIGYPGLVRGYDSGSFDASECGTQSDGSCPVFDRLQGTRVAIGNVELRAPLLALFGAKRLYGPVPVEVGAFFDAGVAWDGGSKPKLLGGERELVRSVGGTARVNLLGFAVLQLDWVKPLDRPAKGSYFTFNLLSGF